MKITDIRTIQLKRPLERTQRNSMEGRKMRSFTFVIVETDAGISGIGDAFGNQALIEPIIRKSLANIAIGLDPLDIENLWKKLFCSSAFWEVGGSVLCAISAIEVACWDIMGKVKGVPVSELLGGAKLDKIEAYASDLHWDEPAHMADAAKGYVDDGFKIVKTHIGNENELDRDLLRLEAIRNAIGSKIGLMIDINTGFDRDAALEQAHKQAQFDPFWYEEPICPIDYAGCAWLREQLSVPIAVGENLYTAHGFQPMFTYKACDFIMPDILRCDRVEITFAESEVIDGIQDIGLTDAIGANQAIDLCIELEFPRIEILVIK